MKNRPLLVNIHKIFAIILSFWIPTIFAQPCSDAQTTIDLTNSKNNEIFISAVEGRTVSPTIILGDQLESSLVVSGCSLYRQQKTKEVIPHRSNLAINLITPTKSNIGQPPRLILKFRKMAFDSLIIKGSADQNNKATPTVDIIFEETSNANRIDIRNVLIRNAKLRVEGNSNIPGEINLTGLSFSGLEIQGLTHETPINAQIDAAILPQGHHQGSSTLSFSNIAFLKGDIRITSSTEGASLEHSSLEYICQNDDRRLSIYLQNVSVGEKLEHTVSLRPSRGKLNLKTNNGICPEISANNFRVFGHVDIESDDVIGQLSLDDVISDVVKTDQFIIKAKAILVLAVGSVSVPNFYLQTDKVSSVNPHITIQSWSFFDVTGSVNMPSYIYENLTDLLLDDDGVKSRTSGIRTFLVNSRWRSLMNGSAKPAAQKSLYAVLRSDTKNLYGSTISTLLDWFTGFGVDLIKPLKAFCLVLIIPSFILSCFARSIYIDFWSSYFPLLITGKPGALPMPFFTNQWVILLVQIQRIFIFIHITLVSLFIQNVVLIGS